MAACVVLTLAMILTNQMSGEAMWFWYGTVFNHGAKIYTDLRTPLQPLFLLEIAGWLRLVGHNLAAYEIPSLVHAGLLILAIHLILCQSNWSSWQKGVVLLGTFVYIVAGNSYRFDDYHVLAEAFITYGLLLLLLIGSPASLGNTKRQWKLSAVLGLVCGLTVVTRVTDGAALLAASALCLFFLVQRKKLASVVLLFLTTIFTILVIEKFTGEPFSAYLSSTVFRAASSKGGTGSIFASPFLVARNTLQALEHEPVFLIPVALMILTGPLLVRYWPRKVRYIIPVQFAVFAVTYTVSNHARKVEIRSGYLVTYLVLALTLVMYAVLAIVIARFATSRRDGQNWDARQILILLPILEWASYSAGAAAEPLTNYYAPVALLVLLIPVINPLPKQTTWLRPVVAGFMALIALTGITGKIITPYRWQNYYYGHMFMNRVWYQHPVYGAMYINRELLHFSQRVCSDIGAVPGQPGPELLSLPYPYPNYFCHTPPWHNYVQTFFDTSTRDTVEQMMRELETKPPMWVIYQRQLNIMFGSERLYNHGRRIAQRDLDDLIMRKLASGEWTLVDESGYLRPNWWKNTKETDWYIIRTNQSSAIHGGTH